MWSLRSSPAYGMFNVTLTVVMFLNELCMHRGFSSSRVRYGNRPEVPGRSYEQSVERYVKEAIDILFHSNMDTRQHALHRGHI